jgi:Tfp pilus assembly protein PilW
MFCNAAHNAGYYCMTAPAPDLVTVQQGQKQYTQYLADGFPQFSAQYADFYEIQAQGYQKNYSLYQSFVQQASAQALSANPNVYVLAGLTTNPPPQEEGSPVLADFTTDITNTRAAAFGGYWLNIPSPGQNCPKCGPPNIPLAESVIQAENSKNR